MRTKAATGFTLIELLVVVAIIGLLSGIVLVSVNQVRGKARDAQRKTALNQVRTALELYHNDNGRYPVSPSASWSSSEAGDPLYQQAEYVPGLAPQYISTLPRDPLGDISPYIGAPYRRAYIYISDGAGVMYKFLSHGASENGYSTTDGFYDPTRPSWGWMVCSVGKASCAW